MKKPHLEFYKKCLQRREWMPYEGGLCENVRRCGLSSKDFKELFANGFSSFNYWGYGVDGQNDWGKYGLRIESKFTPLRQNIVLLLAAVNNEL